MKVVFVNGYFPQLSQTFVLDQIDFAHRLGLDVEVFAASSAPGLHHEVIEKHDLYRRLISPNKENRTSYLTRVLLGAERALSKRLNRAVASRKLTIFEAIAATRLSPSPDVLLVNFGTNLPHALKIKRHAFPKAKIACIFHGFDVSKYPREQGWGMYEEASSDVDLALTVNQVWADKLRNRALFQRVECHHLGVPVERLPARERHGDRGFTIGFVGRAVEKKGVEYLLSALSHLSDIDYRCILVGGGKRLRDLVWYARGAGVGDRVVFLGERPHEFVLDVMRTLDCLVAPSVTARDGDMEGIPVTLMEAMAIGIPVVSTFHSGIPELISDGVSGLLVPEREPVALAAAIREVKARGDELAVEARKAIHRDFNQGVQYGKLFRRLEMLATPVLTPQSDASSLHA